MFIREVFGENVPEILDDEEAMSTIAKFFENNLNISETAKADFMCTEIHWYIDLSVLKRR